MILVWIKKNGWHRGWQKKERERERGRLSKLFRKKITNIEHSMKTITNLAWHIKKILLALPSVSITPKSMTYRDTAYLKLPTF